jgi:hypothetical protein
LLAGAFLDLGRSADPSFFLVMASLLPPFFIGAVTEWGGIAGTLRTEGFGALVGPATQTYLALFLLGEGAALYAVAAQVQTTFLLLTTLVCLVVFSADLVTNIVARATGVVLPAWLARRYEERGPKS